MGELSLTNTQVREGKGRVIFVVNSHAGAQTLLNLNQIGSSRRSTMRPTRGDAKVTVLLLLHDSHFVLIYNLDQLSSARSIRLPGS